MIGWLLCRVGAHASALEWFTDRSGAYPADVPVEVCDRCGATK